MKNEQFIPFPRVKNKGGRKPLPRKEFSEFFCYYCKVIHPIKKLGKSKRVYSTGKGECALGKNNAYKKTEAYRLRLEREKLKRKMRNEFV